jgi:hypothetical protein
MTKDEREALDRMRKAERRPPLTDAEAERIADKGGHTPPLGTVRDKAEADRLLDEARARERRP